MNENKFNILTYSFDLYTYEEKTNESGLVY